MEEKGIDCLGRHWQKIENKKGKDWTNFKYGRLTCLFRVKNLDNNDPKRSWWLAKCSCGNFICIRSDAIQKTKSCGCYKIEKTKKALTKQMIGEKFGKLTVLYQVDNHKLETVWHCRCECGNECDVQRSSLTSGRTRSCGCVVSWKEEEICQLLKKENIKFIRQYRIKECRDKNPLPFDFAIFNKTNMLIGLIEYQGEQHYKQKKQWDDKNDFLIRQEHDSIKENYCKKNDIPLLILNKRNYNDDYIIKEINSWNEKAGG